MRDFVKTYGPVGLLVGSAFLGLAIGAMSPARADGFGYQDGTPAFPNDGFNYRAPPTPTTPQWETQSPFGPLYDDNSADE